MTEVATPRLTYREMRTRAQVILDEKVKERVLKGIVVLNKKYGPDWVDEIEPSDLAMSSGEFCVLGQVYGDYGGGIEALTGQTDEDEGDEGESTTFGVEHGFYETDCGYSQLQDAWSTVLAE